MIGISISLCVNDMVAGRVDPSTVTKIIAGTACPDEKTWNEVIQDYRKWYWEEFPDAAEALLRKFIAEGKIVQPRLTGGIKAAPYHNRRNEHWLQSEDQIRSMPENVEFF